MLRKSRTNLCGRDVTNHPNRDRFPAESDGASFYFAEDVVVDDPDVEGQRNVFDYFGAANAKARVAGDGLEVGYLLQRLDGLPIRMRRSPPESPRPIPTVRTALRWRARW